MSLAAGPPPCPLTPDPLDSLLPPHSPPALSRREVCSLPLSTAVPAQGVRKGLTSLAREKRSPLSLPSGHLVLSKAPEGR